MARTKHTRPKSIIAADRIRKPDGKRSDHDLSCERNLIRALKKLGFETEIDSPNSNLDSAPNHLPRIKVQKARRGFIHPASKEDVRDVLLHFGELAWYGVEEISLSQCQVSSDADKLLLGGLSMPGKVILYEQPKPPWYLAGKLPTDQLKIIEAAGGTVDVSSDGARCKIDWTDDALRDFMLFEVLMHEIGHHIVQHFKGKREAQVLRKKDHEALAESFARSCRESYFFQRGDSK